MKERNSKFYKSQLKRALEKKCTSVTLVFITEERNVNHINQSAVQYTSSLS